MLWSNARKGVITTLLGVAMLLFGGYLLYITEERETTGVEFIIFIAGVGLIIAPDKPKSYGEQ